MIDSSNESNSSPKRPRKYGLYSMDPEPPRRMAPMSYAEPSPTARCTECSQAVRMTGSYVAFAPMRARKDWR